MIQFITANYNRSSFQARPTSQIHLHIYRIIPTGYSPLFYFPTSLCFCGCLIFMAETDNREVFTKPWKIWFNCCTAVSHHWAQFEEAVMEFRLIIFLVGIKRLDGEKLPHIFLTPFVLCSFSCFLSTTFLPQNIFLKIVFPFLSFFLCLHFLPKSVIPLFLTHFMPLSVCVCFSIQHWMGFLNHILTAAHGRSWMV